MKNKWLITLVGLTMALTTVGAAFALNSAGGGDSTDGADTAGEVTHGDPTYEEWLSNYQPNQGPVTSIDDIDPNECNWIHNITACEGEPDPNQHDGPVGEPYPLPTADKTCGSGATVPITSDGQFSCRYFGTSTVNDGPGGQVVGPQPQPASVTWIPTESVTWIPTESATGSTPYINACFSDGQSPADIPMDEYMAVLWLAREDLSQRLAVEIGSIKLAEIERAGWPVYWPEEPQPGVAYIDIALPGFRMVLEADGQAYGYETDTSERVVFVF